MPAQPSTHPTKFKVVVATTVLLSFISFWRAAAIVLNDLASSAFYAAGIAEQAVGKAAPWFILAVMLFSYAVRSVYVESCAMFTRGGVYRVVKEAMGGILAKVSVSALMFDYILTGPISGVSAGQYIIGLIATITTYLGHPWHPAKTTINELSAGIAVLVTLYFWWRNTRGIHESSTDALRIMKITTVMVVLLIAGCVYTLLVHGPAQLPPAPTPHNLDLNRDAVGWLPTVLPGALQPVPVGDHPPVSGGEKVTEDIHYRIPADAGLLIGLIGLLIAFGHSVLAMSGEESLAQVNRELASPKHKNLMRAGLVIFVYSLLFTSLVSFFAGMLIPDATRPKYYDNLIAGLAMNMSGPETLRLIFQGFVVLVGFLILSGAVNTAIIGSNGVLNRVSEDGVLTGWFRAPHRKYGTSYRMINLIVLLQLLTIIGSRGEVYVLGEAYAFGVIWSFTFMSLSMLVLRYKRPAAREWKMPGNLRFGRVEIPVGLGAVALALLMTAVMNLFTKQVATIFGIAFTIVFFVIFTVSEKINRRRADRDQAGLDRFNLAHEEEISEETLNVRPGCILVPVRNYNRLTHLTRVLERTDTQATDIVVMTIRLLQGPGGGEKDIYEENLFTDYEQKLFSEVVAIAEKRGKPVHLLVAPAGNVFDAMAQIARRLDVSQIAVGTSSYADAREQARQIGQAWEKLPDKPRRQVTFLVVEESGQEDTFALGAHQPELTDEDVALIHEIWLGVSGNSRLRKVRHRDVVRVALERLHRDLRGKADVLSDFHKLQNRSDKDR